jgi:hypothetical protein
MVLPVFSRIFQYLQYWYYQYFPESSGIYNTHILAMTSIFKYCRYWKILEDTGILVFTSISGNTSIADTGRFWKILVIPVLQILEDSGKYW